MLNLWREGQNEFVEFPKWPVKTKKGEELLLETYKRGRWGGDFEGSLNEQFESRFAHYNGSKFCATMSSGTAALVTALQVLGIEKDDEVIVPAMTFIATATAVSYIGAVPVFVDINEKDHCMSFEALEKAISKKTKAVIVVHIGGTACNMEPIINLAQNKGIYVIEDCAQALGAQWNGTKVGNYGDLGVFSFAQTKNLVSGEGGAVVTNHDVLHSKVKKMRNHGRENGMNYYHDSLGVNFRLSEIQASLLLPQMENLDCFLQKKKYFSKLLTEAMNYLAFPWLTVMEINKNVTVHGYFSFVFLYHKNHFDNIPKKIICEAMIKEGVPVGNPQFTPYVVQDNPIYLNNLCKNIQYNTNTARLKYFEMIVLGQAVGSAIMLEGERAVQFIIDKIKLINDHREELGRYSEIQRTYSG